VEDQPIEGQSPFFMAQVFMRLKDVDKVERWREQSNVANGQHAQNENHEDQRQPHPFVHKRDEPQALQYPRNREEEGQATQEAIGMNGIVERECLIDHKEALQNEDQEPN